MFSQTRHPNKKMFHLFCCRSSEYEQQLKEITSKSDMLENSLKDLQNELYLEKLDKEKFSSHFETVFNNLKSIANIDTTDKAWLLDKDSLVERLASNSELIKILTEHEKSASKVSCMFRIPLTVELARLYLLF